MLSADAAEREDGVRRGDPRGYLKGGERRSEEEGWRMCFYVTVFV